MCLNLRDAVYWEKQNMGLSNGKDYLKNKTFEANVQKYLLVLLETYLKFNQIITNICKSSISQHSVPVNWGHGGITPWFSYPRGEEDGETLCLTLYQLTHIKFIVELIL